MKKIVIFLFITSVVQIQAKEVKTMIREPVVAGQFYPANPETLKGMIESFLEKANVSPQKNITGIVCPHAGYPYSGQTAAYSFKAISGGEYNTIILIGPSHHSFFDGISVYDKGEWKTPLGIVPVDASLSKEIESYNPGVIKYFPEGHSMEHSLEVEIPFLQVIFPNFKIVPIVMGNQTLNMVNILTDALVKTLKGKDKWLILASSDLYHGYSYSQAYSSDKKVLKYIEDYDGDGLMKYIQEFEMEHRGEQIAAACGFGPIAVMLKTTKALGGSKPKLLNHTTSQDVVGVSPGGYIVGYSSFIVKRRVEKKTEKRADEDIPELSQEEEKTLLTIARETVEHYVRGESVPNFSVKSEKLNEKWGVFVTLTERGNLRGCIGLIRGVEPLYLGVKEMAISAATKDPRFSPVQPKELKDIKIEISVLTPMVKVNDPSEIVVGRDGLYVQYGFYSGLLLPQVATEYGWDRAQFLQETCHKAGLPGNCWKQEGAQLYRFSALIFSE